MSNSPYLLEIEQIKKASLKKLKELSSSELQISTKQDNSLVTEMDIFVSDTVKEVFAKSHPHLNFYCEEDYHEYKFPMIILDPIDGTNEFSKGLPECSISLAIMQTPDIANPQNFGWLFNPFTAFEITSHNKFELTKAELLPLSSGVVSRTEWKKGLFKNEYFKDLNLIPRGSIAFKLGLLAAGSFDFVLSRRPKNSWDIAAGSIIAHRRGIHFYSNKKLVESLEQPIYGENLLWIHPYHLKELEEKTQGHIWR